MFYNETPSASGQTLTFDVNPQPGDVIQFVSPVTNSSTETYTAVFSTGESFPIMYGGEELVQAYLLYSGQTYLAVFTGNGLEITAQQAADAEGNTVNTAPYVINTFLDPAYSGLLTEQMQALSSLAGSVSELTSFTVPITMTAGLSVTGDVNISSGILAVSGTASAAAGTSGTELVNYTQMADGSLTPSFSLIGRDSSQSSQNWLPNSTFLFGLAGWQAPPAGFNIYTHTGTPYAGYGGTDPSLQYWNSSPISSEWTHGGQTCTLSGWVFNPTSAGDASIQVACFTSSGGVLDSVAVSSLSSGLNWTYVSATGILPTGTAYVEVSLGFQGLSSGSNIAFSELKFEFGPAATRWDDLASAQLFQNGQFSPEFDNIQINGSLQLNSNWVNGTDGISIGANVGATAGIMLNAPSGYSGWLEQLMVDGTTMWHVDASGDAVAAGGITAFAANITNNQTIGGTLAVTGTASAAAGTTGTEAVNYTQMTDGSLSPTFGPVTLSPSTTPSQAVAYSQLGNLNGFTNIGSDQTLPGTAYGQAFQVGDGVVVTLPTSEVFGGLLYFYAGGPYSIVSNSNQFIYSPQIGMTDTTGPSTLNCPNGEDVLLFCRGNGEFDIIGGSILVTQALSQTLSHPLSVPAGTTGTEVVNYTQMTDGSLSPTLDSIQVNGPVQLNSSWANGTDGISIGANVGATAGIMLNAPSGYSGWLEQLMIDGTIMWHVDASGDAIAAGEISAFAANITNNQTIGGTLAVTGTASAAAGTAGYELVNYAQTAFLTEKSLSATTTAGNQTITAAQMVGSYFADSATQTATYALTTDTAANLLGALPAAQVGTSFTLRVINNDQSSTGYAMTLAAGSGVTISTALPNPSVGKGLWADYLCTFTAIGASAAVTVVCVGTDSTGWI